MKRRQHSPRQRGNMVVEFALVAPILLAVLMIVVDGGRMLAAYGALKSGVYQASVYATNMKTNATASELINVIAQEGGGLLATNKISVTAITDVPKSQQTMRTISGTYTFSFITPIMSSMSNSVVMSSTSSSVLK